MATGKPLTSWEILDRAADHIERYGWVQDDWYVPGAEWTECKVCAGGAINAAAGYVPDFDEHDDTNEAVARAFEALALRVHEDTAVDAAHSFEFGIEDYLTAITTWNDAEDRTAKQVVTEIRAAAASEREAIR